MCFSSVSDYRHIFSGRRRFHFLMDFPFSSTKVGLQQQLPVDIREELGDLCRAGKWLQFHLPLSLSGSDPLKQLGAAPSSLSRALKPVQTPVLHESGSSSHRGRPELWSEGGGIGNSCGCWLGSSCGRLRRASRGGAPTSGKKWGKSGADAETRATWTLRGAKRAAAVRLSPRLCPRHKLSGGCWSATELHLISEVLILRR